jgi:hypothetical protein
VGLQLGCKYFFFQNSAPSLRSTKLEELTHAEMISFSIIRELEADKLNLFNMSIYAQPYLFGSRAQTFPRLMPPVASCGMLVCPLPDLSAEPDIWLHSAVEMNSG